MLPKISIITVSYNQGEYIEDNIRSVINQNYPNVEHIIIDAGSTDRTLDILKKYDEFISWMSEPDKGQSNGLNKGFTRASGEIIGWINSDDRLAPGSLYKVAKFFVEHPDEIAVVGDQAMIDEKGNLIKIIISRPYNFDYLVNYAKGITQNSTFFKKDVFNKIGLIDESLKYEMDKDLFIRITSIKDIPYIPETLAEFRIHKNTKTARGIFYFAKESIKIRKRYGGRLFSPGMLNDLYIILTQPIRRIELLRKMAQLMKKVLDN
jgi:glycosyltransferase involved in cell wall biosynthesis